MEDLLRRIIRWGGGIYHDTQTVAHDTQSTSANIEDVTPTNAFDAVATMDNTAEQDPEQHGMAFYLGNLESPKFLASYYTTLDEITKYVV